jgi:hypothetical protein
MSMKLPKGFIVVGPDATREECIAAWVKNLRNPNVKQGKGRLIYDGGAMCCLGVACATMGMKPESCAHGLTFGQFPDVMPPPVAKRLGLRYIGGGMSDGRTLWQINDSDSGATFSEIADLIESRPPGLFTE